MECGGATNAPMATPDIPPESTFQGLSGKYFNLGILPSTLSFGDA
jgi:hypothetical protein